MHRVSMADTTEARSYAFTVRVPESDLREMDAAVRELERNTGVKIARSHVARQIFREGMKAWKKKRKGSG